MTTSSNNSDSKKAGVSIKEMAGMVGLSRQRFMQLVKTGVFPAPLRDDGTQRPYYPPDLQEVCLSVRNRNCGINGKVVMFYTRRSSSPVPATKPTKPTAPNARPDCDTDILDGLKALGLVTATQGQVAEARQKLYPTGIKTVDGEVIRAVFMHLRRKNTAENVGRK